MPAPGYSKITPEMAAAILAECENGAPRYLAARNAGVSRRTLDRYTKKNPDFALLLAETCGLVDDQVEAFLANAARGLSTPTAPQVTSAIFWLKNRRPDFWRDRYDTAHSGELTTIVKVIRQGAAA